MNKEMYKLCSNCEENEVKSSHKEICEVCEERAMKCKTCEEKAVIFDVRAANEILCQHCGDQYSIKHWLDWYIEEKGLYAEGKT